MRRSAFLALALAGSALAGCTVGPDYHRPDLSALSAFQEHAGGHSGATLSQVTPAETDIASWWRRFNDPELDSLIARALRGNLDLAQAGARIRQAREQVVIARAAELPTLSATGDAARVAMKGRTLNTGGLAQAASSAAGAASGAAGSAAASSASNGVSLPNRAELFSVGLNASWEIDLFGLTRRDIEAAQAQEEAQVWTARDSLVSLVSQLADTYVALRTDQMRLGVLNSDLKEQQGLFKIIRARFQHGLVTNLDVDQQRAQLANTESQIPQVEADAEAQTHALAILLGLNPEALSDELKPTGKLPPVPPQLPAGLPSDLLRRRPDVRAAERQLAASNAQVGSAVAQFFPTLNLLLLPTYSEIGIAAMFQKPSLNSLGLLQAAEPLFEGGKLRAGVRQARAARDQAFFAYKETALTALREVEDALARYDADQRRWTAISGAFKASSNGYLIATQQYAAGITDYTSVYKAQASLLQIQDELTQADSALATDVVTLYKALGGGWSEADPAAFKLPAQ